MLRLITKETVPDTIQKIVLTDHPKISIKAVGRLHKKPQPLADSISEFRASEIHNLRRLEVGAGAEMISVKSRGTEEEVGG